MVRTAKGVGGDFSVFYSGSVFDAPWDILLAINHALTVLSWWENLPKDEQPPRHIWWSPTLLNEWFEEIRNKRSSSGSKKQTSYQRADDAPMSDNEFAKDLRP